MNMSKDQDRLRKIELLEDRYKFLKDQIKTSTSCMEVYVEVSNELKRLRKLEENKNRHLKAVK